ncbi:MAG: hypothetical protein LC687_05325 [Actinobacteria bacterium]|nr:hypothetical protein [Actinomycetota bacterium]MCA1807251.1 hypothetical protein [Actinomycetota bacterium]
MSNPALLLPAKVRGIVYTVLIFLGLGIGAAQTGFDALGSGYPDWLVVAARVIPYLSAGLGAVALSHTPKAGSATEEYVGDHRNDGYVPPEG